MKNMSEIISFFLWLFTSLFVFYITERINYIKENKIIFQKLLIKLNQNLNNLIRFKSSCQQYIKLIENYRLDELGSIWFPIYNFFNLEDYFPNLFYEKKYEKVLKELRKLDWIVFSLNNFNNDLCINEIKHDFLNWLVRKEESEIRYKQELVVVKEYYKELDKYIEFIIYFISQISLINKFNTRKFLLNMKIIFSETDISNEIKEINKDFYTWVKQIEEFKV